MNKSKKLLSLFLAVTLLLTSIIVVVGAKTTNSIGDINCDGKVSAADARLALRASVGLEKLTDEQFKSADVNNDNKVTASDARTILRVAVGLDKFDIKEENTENKEPDDNKDNIDDNKDNNDNADDIGGNEDTNKSNNYWHFEIDDDNVVITDEYGNGYVNNNIIVLSLIDTENEEFEFEKLISDINGTIIGKTNGIGGMYQIEVPVSDKIKLEELCKHLEKSNLVFSAHLNETSRQKLDKTAKISPVNDPWKDTFQGITGTDWDEENPNGLNWWLETIEALSAWHYNNRFENIKIGVVDSGFDTNHEDLNITILNESVNSASDHGTHVAGVIGATANNNIGISGIVWNKELICVDVEKTENQKENNVSIWNEHYGIFEALKAGAKVVNLSRGRTGENVLNENFEDIYNSGSAAAHNIIYFMQALKRDDFIIVQSASNDGINSVRAGLFCSITEDVVNKYFQDNNISGYTFEDIIEHVIIVGAVEKESSGYQMTDFSNYGSNVSICAPGKDIFSTVVMGGIDGNYAHNLWDGTSMAAPMVTGVASLVWSVNPDFSAGEVKDIVCHSYNKTAAPYHYPTDVRVYPIVNAKLAVEEAIRRTDKKGTATGTFVDSKTGAVVNNVTMECIKYTGDMSNYSLADFNIDATDGTFSCELYEGVYEYKIIADGYTQERNIILNIKTGKCDEKGKINLIQIINDDDNTENSGDDNTGDSGDTEERTVIDSGNCGADGDNVIWTLYEDGELVISGSGEMKDYFMEWYTPWYNYYDNIFNLTVEKGVTTIGTRAFAHCDLRNVKMADTVTKIGAESFFGCDNLSDVMLSQNLSTIGKQSFSFCDKLVQINIPKTVKTINFAFYGCDSLKNIFVDKNNESFASIDGVLFDKYQTTLIHYPVGKENESYAIPDTVTKIRDSAFYYCKNLTSIVIPDSVQELEEDVFDTCNGLINVTIGKNIRSIPRGVFHNCHNIKNVFYTGTLKDWCNINFVSHPFDSHHSGGNLYVGGQLVEDLIIPDEISKINKSAFQRCFSLKTITFSNDVTEIEDYAFKDCNNVKEIIWTASVKKVGTGVFTKDNYDTRTIYYMGQIDDWCDINFSGGILAYGEADLYINGALVENVILKDATEIKDYCFYAYGHLKEVFISSSVEKIASTAFGENYNLKSINVDEDNNYYSSINDVLFNKEKTDLLIYPKNKSDISIYSIPVGVINIRESAFSSNNYIEEVIMSNTVRTISENAFNGCCSLKKINIPDSVTKIEARAFDNCFKLNNITVPSSVESIGEDAFNHLIESRDGYIKIFNPNCSIFESPYTIYYDTIYGYKNSTAQAYAEKYGRTFIPLD